MIAVELATKMTYRDTVKEGKFITEEIFLFKNSWLQQKIEVKGGQNQWQ
ncbi:Uncharacterised protein [uncultured archaeon]|nr:Uncharacterised protein [uncultured archaeon]